MKEFEDSLVVSCDIGGFKVGVSACTKDVASSIVWGRAKRAVTSSDEASPGGVGNLKLSSLCSSPKGVSASAKDVANARERV